jgi:hypothetical protein
MKKKIIVGLGALLVIVVAGLAYLKNKSSSLSPAGRMEITNKDLTVTVRYSKPSVRGRVIFGNKEQNALQPYGEYWRLGANESTEIVFNRDVLFNSEPVKAGTYKLYAIPGPDQFEVVLNRALGTWGYDEPDHTLDLLKMTLPVQRLTSPVEVLNFNALPVDQGVDISFEWSDVKVVIPVR